jgi:altronate dehydratase
VKPALVISSRDNVATALEAIEAGRRLTLGDVVVTALERIPPGHKISLADVAAGQPVVKYGSAIGHATADIRRGEHVHTHNLSSDRGRGDLGTAAPTNVAARLAEPPDSGTVESAELTRRGGSHD